MTVTFLFPFRPPDPSCCIYCLIYTLPTCYPLFSSLTRSLASYSVLPALLHLPTVVIRLSLQARSDLLAGTKHTTTPTSDTSKKRQEQYQRRNILHIPSTDTMNFSSLFIAAFAAVAVARPMFPIVDDTNQELPAFRHPTVSSTDIE